MATIPRTPSVVKDIVNDNELRELWTVCKEMERPPYLHVGKGMDTRLARALRVVQDGRITPNSDGSFTVEGSEGRTYRCAERCSCPNSQKSSSKWCYHLISTFMYVEWQRRLLPAAPVTLGTLRPGTLPLPPTTVDERLAQAVPHTYGARQAEKALGPITTGTMHDSTALSTHHTPQEDRMADTDDQYIPEPDHVSTAVLDALDADFPPMGQTTTTALRPRVPQDDDLEGALQVWTTARAVVQRFLKQELKPNVDYYTLKIGGKESKPSLSKAGAEKVLGWLRWSASFTPDTGTWEMLGKPTDTLCYVCTLRTRSGEIVGEGRGARSLKKDGGDVNKAIKMACKSSMVDSILRTGAMSDVFTQDAEDMQDEPAKGAPAKDVTPAKPTAQELRQRIWATVQQLAPEARTREAVEAFIKERTGMDLHVDLYQAILARMEGRA